MFPSFGSARLARSCWRPLLQRRALPFAPYSRSARRTAEALPNPASYREQLYKENPAHESFQQRFSRPGVWRQAVFVLAGSALAITIAADLTNNDTASWITRFQVVTLWKRGSLPSDDEMRRARQIEFGQSVQQAVTFVKESTALLPKGVNSFLTWLSLKVAVPMLDSSEGRRMTWWICAVNSAVFLLWKIPRWEPIMSRYFMHHPLSGMSMTLLSCVFSHKSFIHLFFNMMALTSFASAATLHLQREHTRMGGTLPESTVKWHFLAFYLSAGMFSSLASHVVATKLAFPHLISRISSLATPARIQAAQASTKTVIPEAGTILPSLGASGAIYASVVVTALAFPDTKIMLIFPPTPPFSITWGVAGMVSLDIIGILRGWRMFDHWAHLGGAAFGAFYYAYGPRLWEAWRRWMVPFGSMRIYTPFINSK